MSILLVGLNHRTAPIEIREQLAFSREGVATALMLFHKQFPKSEAALLSTCNRVEMIVATEADRPNVDDVVTFLAQARDLPVAHFRHCLYEFADEQAIRHLFRVTSGLDSMVLGENQIVSQMKTAYALASEQGTTARVLNKLFHQAFSVSKHVRTETEIGQRKLSIPSVAVDVAQSIFSDLTDKQVLVVGAGEMAQLVCQYLRDAQARHFTVTSRTLQNARALAEACQGTAVPYDQLDQQLAQADIVITAVSCPKAILDGDRLRRVQEQRRGRALFLIDLAVPRNVAPEVERLPQLYLYDIDALGRIVEENQKYRLSQMEACERILDRELEAFEQWMDEHQARPLIQQLYNDARELRDLELARLFQACPDLTEEQRQAVTRLADRLANKLLHPCAYTVKQFSKLPPSLTLARELHAVTIKQRQLA